MQQKLGWKVLIAVAVTAAALWNAFPLSKRINLGLDLQGGMHLILRVDTAAASASARDTYLLCVLFTYGVVS